MRSIDVGGSERAGCGTAVAPTPCAAAAAAESTPPAADTSCCSTLGLCSGCDECSIAERLNELLDSIHCRQVLARLKAQGFSDHVAQVGAAAGGAAAVLRESEHWRRTSRIPQPLLNGRLAPVPAICLWVKHPPASLPACLPACSVPAWRCTRPSAR